MRPSEPHEQKSPDAMSIHHVGCPQNQDGQEAAGIYTWGSPLSVTWAEAEKEHCPAAPWGVPPHTHIP